MTVFSRALVLLFSLTAVQGSFAQSGDERSLTILAPKELKPLTLLQLSDKLIEVYQALNGKNLGYLGDLSKIQCRVTDPILVTCQLTFVTPSNWTSNKVLTAEVSYLDYLVGEQIHSLAVSSLPKN